MIINILIVKYSPFCCVAFLCPSEQVDLPSTVFHTFTPTMYAIGLEFMPIIMQTQGFQALTRVPSNPTIVYGWDKGVKA
jgi:hypothetical protein